MAIGLPNLTLIVKQTLRAADPVTEFIEAFNERDLDRFTSILDPEIQIHGMKGLRRGIDEAREWATRVPGGVQQEIEVERVLRPPAAVPGRAGGLADGPAVALIVRHWHWEEDGGLAGADEMAWLFVLRGGLVLSWRPFDDRGGALRAAGIA